MSPVFKLTILTQTYNFWNTNNFLLASLSLQAKLGINYSFCLVPNFPLLIISLPFHAPSPCPSALSLACTNPFVVDREALALAKLSILEGLVQLRGAYMPFPLSFPPTGIPVTTTSHIEHSLFLFTLKQFFSLSSHVYVVSLLRLLVFTSPERVLGSWRTLDRCCAGTCIWGAVLPFCCCCCAYWRQMLRRRDICSRLSWPWNCLWNLIRSHSI